MKNPQFLVELKDSGDGDGKCLCIIALTQKYRRRQGLQELPIGFIIYHVSMCVLCVCVVCVCVCV